MALNESAAVSLTKIKMHQMRYKMDIRWILLENNNYLYFLENYV